jgi:PKD repeat protein
MVRASAVLALVIAGALAPTAGAQGPSFDYTPSQPFTGQTVTLTSSSDPSTVTWDLDNDGQCDDGINSPITHVFATAGTYPVSVCLPDNSKQIRPIIVLNSPPVASFTLVPAAPVARQPVVLTSTAVDPDGPIVAQAWDLNGDGVFGDAVGENAFYSWPRAGTYPIALRVTDRDGAAAVAQASVVVAPRPALSFSPAPLVRVVGQPTPTGAHLDLLTVTAPKGAHVGVRCKGRSCPYKHKRFTSKGKRVTLRALSRSYPDGTVIEVRVTKSETIGKFTRLRIRAGRSPARLDRCLQPGKPNKPVRCPS